MLTNLSISDLRGYYFLFTLALGSRGRGVNKKTAVKRVLSKGYSRSHRKAFKRRIVDKGGLKRTWGNYFNGHGTLLNSPTCPNSHLTRKGPTITELDFWRFSNYNVVYKVTNTNSPRLPYCGISVLSLRTVSHLYRLLISNKCSTPAKKTNKKHSRLSWQNRPTVRTKASKGYFSVMLLRVA